LVIAQGLLKAIENFVAAGSLDEDPAGRQTFIPQGAVPETLRGLISPGVPMERISKHSFFYQPTAPMGRKIKSVL
jgi:hypothetical protein